MLLYICIMPEDPQPLPPPLPWDIGIPRNQRASTQPIVKVTTSSIFFSTYPFSARDFSLAYTCRIHPKGMTNASSPAEAGLLSNSNAPGWTLTIEIWRIEEDAKHRHRDRQQQQQQQAASIKHQAASSEQPAAERMPSPCTLSRTVNTRGSRLRAGCMSRKAGRDWIGRGGGCR